VLIVQGVGDVTHMVHRINLNFWTPANNIILVL